MSDDELFSSVSNGLNALIAERDDWKQAAHDMADRALEVEAAVERLRGLLREARVFLWEPPGADVRARIDAELAEDKP